MWYGCLRQNDTYTLDKSNYIPSICNRLVCHQQHMRVGTVFLIPDIQLGTQIQDSI